jgi:hypothetical protein
MKTKVIFILMVLVITSCRAETDHFLAEIDECIPPLESFAYPVSITSDDVVPESKEMQIPPAWEVETDIPGNLDLQFSRKTGGDVELWFAEYSYSLSEDASQRFSKQFHLYDVKTKNIETISAEIGETGIFVDELLYSDNFVWGTVDIEEAVKNEISVHSVLSLYNENTKQFEMVEEVSNIPYTVAKQTWHSGYWVSILVDNTGVFWFLVPEDAIYSYAPKSKKVTRIIDLELIPEVPVISNNGKIYFLTFPREKGQGSAITARDVRVYEFDSDKDVLEQLPIWLTPWPFYPNILVDHDNRLWLGAVGFREEDGTVYQLEQASIFIVNELESGLDFRWSSPELIFESSNGLLWYKSKNGIANLNIEEEKWCWVSTSKSNVIEDGNQTLWMVAYGKLYRNDLTN